MIKTMEKSNNYVPLKEDWDNDPIVTEYIHTYDIHPMQRVTAGCLAFVVLSGIILGGTIITLGIINLIVK
jgi:hypothetical protein